MFGRIALVVASLLCGLLVLELGCRAARGPQALLHWQNIVLGQRQAMARQNLESRFLYDPQLGYVPTPGFRSKDTNYDQDGFRLMPPLPADATDRPPVLATGDSFTLGDEAGDDESWPAVLQGLVKRRTVNAGVAAYGIDQTVLRTEILAARLKPSIIVVGFIADDLRRAEMSRAWGVEKPYFTVKGDELELHNVPVPPSPSPRDTLDFWQRTFGWSVLVDTLLVHQGWQYEWSVDHHRVTPRGTGERLACLLMKRLVRLGVPTLVVAQYDRYVWQDREFATEQRRITQGVLKCAAAEGLATLDLHAALARAIEAEGREKIYGTWHHTAAGYALIGREIAAELGRRHMLGGVPR